MLELLLGVNLLGWLALGVLTFVTLALARQIGVLNERIAPAGSAVPSPGIAVGEAVPPLVVHDLAGREATVGGASPRGVLVLFVSPTCPLCRDLVPVAAELARGRRIDLLYASEGVDAEAHRRYAVQQGIEAPYVLSPELVRRHQVVALPVALLIDATGMLIAKGRVDSREELTQLLDRGRSAAPSAARPVALGEHADEPRSSS